MNQASWLLIDFDGVLAERSQDRSQLVAKRLGIDPKIARDFYTQGYKDIFRLASEAWEIKSIPDEVEFYFHLFSELAFVNKLEFPRKQLYELAKDFVAVPFELIPGVKKTLDLLETQYKLGLFSDAHATRRQGELTYLRLISYFDLILISGELGFDKCSSKFYANAVVETNVDPKNLRLIDNEANKLQMAKENGFGDGFLITTDSSSEWQTFPSLAELGAQLTLESAQ